jgi:hypothetical protein
MLHLLGYIYVRCKRCAFKKGPRFRQKVDLETLKDNIGHNSAKRQESCQLHGFKVNKFAKLLTCKKNTNMT